MSFILLIKINPSQWHQCELISAEECPETQIPEGFQRLLPDEDDYLSILERIHAPDYLLESEKIALGSVLESSFFYYRMTTVTDYCRIYLTNEMAQHPGTAPFLHKKSKQAKAFNTSIAPSNAWLDSEDWIFTNIARFFGQQPAILEAMLKGSLFYERCSFNDTPPLNAIPLAHYSHEEGLRVWEGYKRYQQRELIKGFITLGIGVGIGMLSAFPLLMPFMLFGGASAASRDNQDAQSNMLVHPDTQYHATGLDDALIEQFIANVQNSGSSMYGEFNRMNAGIKLLKNPLKNKQEILKEMKEGNTQLISRLIDSDFDLNSFHTKDSDSSPLYSLFKEKRDKLASALLQTGRIDLNYIFENGPLITLITGDKRISFDRKFEICKLLIANKAELNVPDYRKNPLVQATIDNNLQLVKLFIKKGALSISHQFHLLYFSLKFKAFSVSNYLLNDIGLGMNELLVLDTRLPEQRIPVMALTYDQEPKTMITFVEKKVLQLQTVDHYRMMLLKKAFTDGNRQFALETSILLMFEHGTDKLLADLQTLKDLHQDIAETIDIFLAENLIFQHSGSLAITSYLYLCAGVLGTILVKKYLEQRCKEPTKEALISQKINKKRHDNQIVKNDKPLIKPVHPIVKNNAPESSQQILNKQYLETISLYQKTIKRLKEKDFSNDFTAIDQIKTRDNYIEESRIIFTNYKNKTEKNNLDIMNVCETTLEKLQKQIETDPSGSFDMRTLDKIQLELEAITTDQENIKKRIEDTYKHMPKKEKIKSTGEAKKPRKIYESQPKPRKSQQPTTVIPRIVKDRNPVIQRQEILPGTQHDIALKPSFFEKSEKTESHKQQKNQTIIKDFRIFYVIHLMQLMANLDTQYTDIDKENILGLEKLNDAASQLLSKAADIMYGIFLSYQHLNKNFPLWKELLALRNNILHRPKLLEQIDLHQFLKDFKKTFYDPFDQLKNKGNFEQSITNAHFKDLRLFGVHPEESLIDLTYPAVTQKLIAHCYKMNRYYQMACDSFAAGKLELDGILHAAMASCFLQWREIYREIHHLFEMSPEPKNAFYFNVKKACRDLLILPGFKNACELGNTIAHATTDYNHRITIDGKDGYKFATLPNEYEDQGKIFYVQEPVPYLSLFESLGLMNNKLIPGILNCLDQEPLPKIKLSLPDIGFNLD